jgi:hypothetical protein
MNRVLIASAIIAFGMVPALGAACEYADDSWASATPPEKIGAVAPAPASTVPPATPAKTATAKVATPTPTAKKAKAPAPEQKVAANTKS